MANLAFADRLMAAGIPAEGANLLAPVNLSAAQIASPTADLIANINANYRLNVAPYTWYQSNGTTLIAVSAAGNASLSATQTFTGTNSFGDGTAAPIILFNGAAGAEKGVHIQDAGVARWSIVTDSSDNLNLYAYNAAGAFLDTAWEALQSTATVNFNYQVSTNNHTSPIAGGVAGPLFGTHNIGTNSAQGALFQYFSVGGGAGFDTGATFISTFDPVFQGATVHNSQTIYIVCESPNDTSHTWGGNIGEMNYVNRGPDVGFKRSRQDAGNNTGGLLFVPESIVISGGPGEGKNVAYGFSVARSGGVNSTGFPVKSYIGFNVEPNAIVGLTGRGIYITGDVTGVSSQYPYGPLQHDGTWLHGTDHTLAVYVDGNAHTFLVGQALAWIVGTTASPTASATIAGSGSGANASLTLTPAGTGVVSLAGLTQLKSYTVSGLPAAASNAGCIAYVTDATSPTFNATLTGGGAVKCLAMSNGTDWTAH